MRGNETNVKMNDNRMGKMFVFYKMGLSNEFALQGDGVRSKIVLS